MHICRGNSRSRWAYQGGYNPIAEALFSQVGVDTFLLGVRLGRARWHL
jgi:5-methyltetrahydropteroyltriglutamate--homocysteine methyltransferase